MVPGAREVPFSLNEPRLPPPSSSPLDTTFLDVRSQTDLEFGLFLYIKWYVTSNFHTDTRTSFDCSSCTAYLLQVRDSLPARSRRSTILKTRGDSEGLSTTLSTVSVRVLGFTNHDQLNPPAKRAIILSIAAGPNTGKTAPTCSVDEHALGQSMGTV